MLAAASQFHILRAAHGNSLDVTLSAVSVIKGERSERMATRLPPKRCSSSHTCRIVGCVECDRIAASVVAVRVIPQCFAGGECCLMVHTKPLILHVFLHLIRAFFFGLASSELHTKVGQHFGRLVDSKVKPKDPYYHFCSLCEA